MYILNKVKQRGLLPSVNAQIKATPKLENTLIKNKTTLPATN